MSKWNSIKDGLPPIGYPLIVTIYDSIKNRKELRYPVYYQQNLYCDEYGFYVYGTEYLTPEYSRVLAWMKVPSVYEEQLKTKENESIDNNFCEWNYDSSCKDTIRPFHHKYMIGMYKECLKEYPFCSCCGRKIKVVDKY